MKPHFHNEVHWNLEMAYYQSGVQVISNWTNIKKIANKEDKTTDY